MPSHRQWDRVQPSKFADVTKLSAAEDKPEGWDAIQRDLDKLEKWTCGNLMRFKKPKCKMVELSQSNPWYRYNLSDEQIKSSSIKKDLGVEMDITSNVHLQPRKPIGWAYPRPGLRPGLGVTQALKVFSSMDFQGDICLPWIFTTGPQEIMAYESTPVFLWRSLPTEEQSLTDLSDMGLAWIPHLDPKLTRAILTPA
ncbi:hypothetical protein BTVI_42821 [Pitangus sulphuratus]|nr:hypothetical protein BTVI_42821 [Pitangus sulphuratus]